MRTKLVMVAVALCAGVLAGGLAGCSTLGGSALDHATPSAFGPWTEALADVRVEHRQTIEGVGAAQGLVVHNGFIYVFGDAETGVIREYRVAWTGGEPRLAYTGREILCTVDGVDVAPHPTGLTFHPELGCYLGDTVKRVGTRWYLPDPTGGPDRRVRRPRRGPGRAGDARLPATRGPGRVAVRLGAGGGAGRGVSTDWSTGCRWPPRHQGQVGSTRFTMRPARNTRGARGWLRATWSRQTPPHRTTP